MGHAGNIHFSSPFHIGVAAKVAARQRTKPATAEFEWSLVPIPLNANSRCMLFIQNHLQNGMPWCRAPAVFRKHCTGWAIFHSAPLSAAPPSESLPVGQARRQPSIREGDIAFLWLIQNHAQRGAASPAALLENPDGQWVLVVFQGVFNRFARFFRDRQHIYSCLIFLALTKQ
jgi:hypothetical protein